MGIPLPLIEFFLQEHAYRPLSGRILTLGRQTVFADPSQLRSVLHRYGIAFDPVSAAIDKMTMQALATPDRDFVIDTTMFRSFTDAHVDIMDVTNYEGANIIHDLCAPVSADLAGQYDLIFNGSVLDNIFDPAQAMRNMTRLLKPDGRVIHLEMASNLAFEYLMFSTDWFVDYAVVNGFRDCRIYICTFETVEQLLHGPWQVYAYFPKPDGTGFSLRSLPYKQAVLVVVAERGPKTTHDVSPVQWCYRDDAMQQSFAGNLANLSGARPIFGFGRGQRKFNDLRGGGFLDCGTTTMA